MAFLWAVLLSILLHGVGVERPTPDRQFIVLDELRLFSNQCEKIDYGCFAKGSPILNYDSSHELPSQNQGEIKTIPFFEKGSELVTCCIGGNSRSIRKSFLLNPLCLNSPAWRFGGVSL